MPTRPLGIYVRVSRRGDREDERFHSPREQAERARAHARARGFATAEPPFNDVNVSGATHPNDRPQMRDLLQRIRDGELGGIVAYSLDRLSRDPSHGDWLIREVTQARGIVTAPDLPEDIDSPAGEFTFGMLLGVARLYRRTAGERFAGAKERATLAGIPVGPVPVGYRQRDDRTIEVDPDVAPIIRELFERRARGEGYEALARFLDERGVSTARDRNGGRRTTWTRQGVATMLRNPFYATGRLEYGGVVSEHDAGAIIDVPLFHAAQRPEARPRPQRNPHSTWLLTGFARCGSCGHSLAPWQSARRNGRTYRRYKCPNRACEDRASIDADRLERRVVQDLIALLGARIETPHDAPNLLPLEDALDTAERRLAQVMAPEARDALGELWYADVKTRREERDQAAHALGRARTEAPAATVDVTDLAARWDELPVAERRALLANVYGLERVVVKRGSGGPELHLR
jgi:DNA invertase Pin-like site-specific DNA recombinase